MACPCTFHQCGGPDCTAPTAKQVFSCDAKACGSDDLKPDETWGCGDCGGNFCDEHIHYCSEVIERSMGKVLHGLVHLCAPCATRRAIQQPGRIRFDDREYAA